MNTTLGPTAAVHAAHRNDVQNPECGGNKASARYKATTMQVTCKRCLKIVAAREEAAARTAYLADLRDEQDETLSQASPADKTVGLVVHTDNGMIPGQALLADVTKLAWIPGIRQGVVTTAMEDDEDFGLTVWVYARFEGEGHVRMLYKGDDWTAARQARSEFVALHTRSVELASVSVAGVKVSEPTKAKMTVYRAAPVTVIVGRRAVPVTPLTIQPSHETPVPADTDPDTGLPVVTVGGRRYVVGLVQTPADGYPAYARYWLADSVTGFSNIWRAYEDDDHGTTGRAVWDAQQALRNG